MDYKSINKQTYNTISQDWEEKRKYFWHPVKTFLQNQLNKQELKLLDLGCGTGRHLQLAKSLGYKKSNIAGCDFAPNQLKQVKQLGFRTILSDLTDLKIKDNTFDIIICIAAHHHLLDKPSQLKSLKEMNRILKPNGKILLANWLPEKDFLKKQLEKGKFQYINKTKKQVKVTYTYQNTKHDRYYYLFSETELKNLCKKADLKTTNIETFKGNIYLELTN